MEEEEEEDDPADEDGAPKVTCMDRLHGFVETFPIMGDCDSYVIGSESEFRLTDTYYYYHTLSSCTERLRYYVYNNMYIYICVYMYISMDWLKGKSTGNHRFSYELWVFPIFFPLHQSIEYIVQLRYYDIRTLAMALEELADSMLKSVSSSKPKKSRSGPHEAASLALFFPMEKMGSMVI